MMTESTSKSNITNEGTSLENKKTEPNKHLRTLRIILNISLLLVTTTIIVQNARTITIDFLWTQFDIPLSILMFITGSIGSVITLFFLLFKK